MKFDKIIKAFLPKEDHFYKLFEEASITLVKGAGLLRKLPSASINERQAIAQQISDCEHECDLISHKIFSELDRTFLTPFDREDVYKLTSSVDEIMDYMDGAARRFTYYKLEVCPPEMVKLIEILATSVEEVHRGIQSVRNLNDRELMQRAIKKINTYENEADFIYEHAIADLFETEKDAIKLIKLKEIYYGLETASDKCEDTANVLESILIKHA
ncbi:MAG: DUF47 family protein [Bacteroidetes bacterium]|nr:DUF47 family protein [Bacteroidota bacterium]